jgi:general secretion pathway protein A
MEESIGYVARRILAAGGEPARLFTREAVLLLTEFALGIPRTINVLADNALLGGFAAGQRPVQTQMVREICRDFEIAVPAPVRREAPAPMAPMSGPVLTRAEQDALDFDLPLVH